MPAQQRGSVLKTKTGYGIRWYEDGHRRQRVGFDTKTAARNWWSETIKPQLDRGAPSNELTFDEFCDRFLERHTASERTVKTLRERLVPARRTFGSWPLRDLEHAAADIARWRAALPNDKARYRHTRALRECLEAAVRWRCILRNPAKEAGRNPEPPNEGPFPFSREEVDAIAAAIDPRYSALVLFAAETGLRTQEWVALERRDIDRAGRAVVVERTYSDGVLTPDGKTGRRRVELTRRAVDALAGVPPRLDTPLVFPAPGGGYINIDNWRRRIWYPALKAAGVEQRGPYQLRATYATEVLAAGATTWRLSRAMGASGKIIEKHYGHLAQDSGESLRDMLDARAGRLGVVQVSDPQGGE